MREATGRVQIIGPMEDRYAEILTPRALELLVALHDALAERRHEALNARRTRQVQISAGANFDFLPQTRHIREDGTWRVAPPAPGLHDRRVEITGPADRKITINALNSCANVWLADFAGASTTISEKLIARTCKLHDRRY